MPVGTERQPGTVATRREFAATLASIASGCFSEAQKNGFRGAARLLPVSRVMSKRSRCHAILFLVPALFAAGGVRGSDREEGTTLLVATGWFDANRKRDQAAEGRLELRSGTFAAGARAVAAAIATTDGSLFAGLGVVYPIRLGHWDVTPSFVPGLYRRGHGRDLGYPLEFRSQLELGWRFAGGRRVAIALSHLSNAGLGTSNPGQESLTMSYEWCGNRRSR